ncbi:class II histone deacetylase [Bradyrhizobium sp. LHD-71]|uniref:class II histone deacetylase n=1 Tax=Bradyrhizobium sp. LHD-71 TaxID=3072141 RepID=UPI00280F50B0|nr:class II histone deacetylase [Bradyrhizobium sp. LHD-71]MDQ8727992.1 class II histone deacetylase [Bradyrhizobium sp. LHD-71]
MTTGFLWHELFAWHVAGGYPQFQVEPIGSADTPEGKRRIRNLIDVSGLLDQLKVLPFNEATDEAILRVHTRNYLGRLSEIDKVGGYVGRFAHIGQGGLRIVRLAAGAAMAAVDAVMNRTVKNAYALVRPAGHHANADVGAGFCIVNNVAVAARHAQAINGLKRVAIVDWDVHHGNGSQDIFWQDPSVLTISIHQELLYQQGGHLSEIGEGAGRGANLNIPLPPGSGNDAYMETMQRVVLKALDRFRPELILVASGLDATSHDALGRMNLYSDSYRSMTSLLMEAAGRLCDDRLVLVHEGGYSSTVTPFAGLAILETLSGISTGAVDPFAENVRRQPAQKIQPHQETVITQAEANVSMVPAG